MELFSVFVSGANRGIGLEFVRQLVKLPTPPKYVFATYRSRDGVQALKSIRDSSKKSEILMIKMDVTKRNEIEAARQIVQDMVGVKGLTLLINNAGVLASQEFPHITEENLLYHFKTNTIGPTMLIQELLPLLESAAAVCKPDSGMGVQRAAILNISAGLGSISMVDVNKKDFLGHHGYQISKAALNMMARVVAAKLKSNGILVVCMCPGWTKTDLGTDAAFLKVEDSVSSMLKTLATLSESHHGEFVDRNGKLYTF